MNPEVSPRGGIPDRIVTLAWPRSHGSISRQMVGHEREISRVGGALEENCKKRFYSRLFDSDTKDFEVLEITNGRNRCRVDEIRRRLAIYRCEQRWYSPTIFTKTRGETRTGTRTTCTTFSKLDTELPRDLTSLNDRPCRVCGFSFLFF